MDRLILNVLGLTTSQSHTGAYALILEAEETRARIPIIIGASEAQSIAIALEGLKPPRPLTHDLFVNLANSQNTKLIESEIYKLVNGVFYAKLVFKSPLGTFKMDARTSDAVALSIRFNAPIYTSKAVLDQSGILPEEHFSSSKEPQQKVLSTQEKIEKLEEEMNLAVSKEQYHEAAKLKQQIDELKKKL